MSTHPRLICQGIGEAPETSVLALLIIRFTAFCRDLGIEVAISAETSAEGDVDIDHGYLSINSAEPRSDWLVYTSTV